MELRLPPIRDLQLAPQHSTDYPYPKFQSYPQPDPDSRRPRDECLNKIAGHCKVLCAFAEHYAAAPPNLEPPEMGKMVEHALQVTKILEGYKCSAFPTPTPAPSPGPVPVHRPKRPWEDADAVPETPAVTSSSTSANPAPHSAPTSQEAHMHVFDSGTEHPPRVDEVAQAAIRDMEGIRARCVSASPAGKVKYKKRSRASPPSQCHSCEILDTPEWRRGPDGQRTLCNACGLQYAKLVRKRDRIISTLPEGVQSPPPIDIVFLRKSARLASENSSLNRSYHRRRAADDAKACSNRKRSADHLEPHAGESSAESLGRRGWGRREVTKQAKAASVGRPPATPTYTPPHQHTSPVHHSAPMALPPPAPAHQTTLPSTRPSPYPAPMPYPGAPYPHSGYHHVQYPQHGPPLSYPPMQMGYNYGYPPPQHHPGQADWDRHARHSR